MNASSISHVSLKAGLVGLILGGASSQVLAVPFEPTFSDYSFPGTQHTVDADTNAFFYTNYGLNIDNAYLYRDDRDTFDGTGISVGEVSGIGTPQTGVIDFIDTTDFVSVDYWGIYPTAYAAYDTDDNLVDSFSIEADSQGTHLFETSGRISYLTWSSIGGFGQVTGLRYDYDGNTDGVNDDLEDPTTVPEPGSLALLGVGLAALGGIRRRSKKAKHA